MNRALVMVSLSLLSAGAFANGQWNFATTAKAYGGDSSTYTQFDFNGWQAQGLSIDQSDQSNGHPNDPPFTNSTSRLIFDQSDPTNATMRLFARAGRGYDAHDAATMTATSSISIAFDLAVENLSNQNLNIVIGNRLHGVFANLEGSEVSISEETNIGWFGFNRGQVVKTDYDDPVESGMFLGTTDFGLIDDSYFSIVEGYDFNSFYFYGSRLFTPGEKATTTVEHLFDVRASLFSSSGLAIVDMMNTGDFVVRAYDDFGNDRTGDIRVGIVPEPATIATLGLGLAAIARRRRSRAK